MKLKSIYFIVAAILFTVIGGCEEDVPMLSLGIDDYYYINRMQKLELNPVFTGKEYRWYVKTANGEDSLLSTERKYIFLTAEERIYDFTFEILDSVNPYKYHFKVNVLHEEVEYSPYISKVYEYRPAPGQFINTMPQYEKGDTEKSMCKKVEECISGKNDIMISLGAYGGYVTFGFDHTVMNVPGQKDFLIKGNAFYSDIPGYANKKGGSSEPGVVMVAYDRNMNGYPDDDEWYELAGSEYDKPETIKNYQITYSRPEDGKKPVTDITGALIDTEYILWKDNRDNTGYIAQNMYHTQNYYPEWLSDDKLTFEGTLLPPNGKDESGFGTYWVLYAYSWGYADNHPNTYKDLNSFDISWAVDKKGNPVHLPGIDFVRVFTGVNQYCGWLGETSTEISYAQDLHISLY